MFSLLNWFLVVIFCVICKQPFVSNFISAKYLSESISDTTNCSVSKFTTNSRERGVHPTQKHDAKSEALVTASVTFGCIIGIVVVIGGAIVGIKHIRNRLRARSQTYVIQQGEMLFESRSSRSTTLSTETTIINLGSNQSVLTNSSETQRNNTKNQQ